DIWSAVKTWTYHSDHILQLLCSRLIARSLYHTELHAAVPGEEVIAQLKAAAVNHFDIDVADVDYYVWVQAIENSAYEPNNGTIKILMKDGSIQDIAEA